MPLQVIHDADAATFDCASASEAVVSWNCAAPQGSIMLRAGDAAAWFSDWLPLASWEAGERRSHSPRAEGVRVEIDTLVSERPFTRVAVRASVACSAMALATPFGKGPRGSAYPTEDAHDVLVPERSQYVVEGVRTWCSAAATSMLMGYHARRMLHDAWNLDVATVAERVFDKAYDGTGNWAFNVALAGSLGLFGAVAFLQDFEHARRLIRAAVPLAISFSWDSGELPGAPIEHSSGHIAVLRGFTSRGDPILNDPAAPAIRVTYPRDILERLWTAHGGVAYVIATRERTDIVPLANA